VGSVGDWKVAAPSGAASAPAIGYPAVGNHFFDTPRAPSVDRAPLLEFGNEEKMKKEKRRKTLSHQELATFAP
jgi:hypothetical protein